MRGKHFRHFLCLRHKSEQLLGSEVRQFRMKLDVGKTEVQLPQEVGGGSEVTRGRNPLKDLVRERLPC